MKTILFADDDKAFREIGRRVLEDEGYRIVLARNDTEAIDCVKIERPDLAILDIHMPMKGGMDAAERIYSLDKSIPIILYTANDDSARRDNRSCYAAACVEKSGDLSELLYTIVRLLRLGNKSSSFRFGLNPLPQNQCPQQNNCTSE
jgi:CheY-like chemotaxis protein